MKKISLIAILFSCLATVNAQRFSTVNATVGFVNKSKVETIQATNKAGTFVIDSKTGGVAMSVTIKSFSFENSTMQQHFNDNYMESGKFPKAEFRGTITNNSEIIYTKDGSYTAKVTGKLTMHGVTKDISTIATIVIKSGVITATAAFNATLKDYKISSDGVGNAVTINVSTGTLTKK